MLLPGEKILADLGYRGEETVITPDDAIEPEVLALMTQARACHEGVNGLFKQFRISVIFSVMTVPNTQMF